MDGLTMQICRECGVSKDTSEFHRDRTRDSGITTICKPCKREYQRFRKAESLKASRDWYARNREAECSRANDYKLKNPDKARKHASTQRAKKRNVIVDLSQEDKDRIDHLYWMAKDCQAVSGELYHVDHIVPMSKGGEHHPDNMQVMYWKDNLVKYNKVVQ